jgi:hypothetical protein
MPFTRFSGGRLPPYPDETHPRLWISDFIHPARYPGGVAGPIIEAELTADWNSRIEVDAWGMDLNDQLGDCGIAAMDHWQMAARATSGQSFASWGNTVSLSLYEQLGGYVADNPATDNGTVLQDNLALWQKEGVPTGSGTDKILAYGALRPGSWDRSMRVKTMQTFGPGYTGINCPETAESQFPGPWTLVPGAAIAGGHCTVTAAEYAATNEIREISWGASVPTNEAFLMAYTEEYWVIISDDTLENAKANPYGVDLQGMNEALASLTGRSNPLGLKSIIAPGGIPVSEPTEAAAVDETVDGPQPIPVADQKAAGVPDDETVTMADQAAGADAPQAAVDAQTEPVAMAETPRSASNETPPLPANAQAAAARAHAILGHFIDVAQRGQADLERYVPAGMLQGAKQEALSLIREVLF